VVTQSHRRVRRFRRQAVCSAAKAGTRVCGAYAPACVAPSPREATDAVAGFSLGTQSVSTSDCFDRVDLEAKWSALPAASRQAALEALGQPQAEASEPGRSAAADSGQPASETAATDPQAWSRELLEKLQAFVAEQQRQLASGAEGVRAKVAELDGSFNLGAKSRMATQKLRDAVLKADAAMGVSAAARKYGPPAWRAFNEARATPVGQVLWFLATTWVFLSGAFWTLLSWFFLASLVLQVVAPNLVQRTVEDAIASAMREAQQAAGGGAPPPPPRGGASAGRPADGMGYSPGRRDLSRDSNSGTVVDVDAQIKD
jgi:hypothetical protein